ncbi:phosphoglycerate dehydrogenase-like enzyme [Streptomyces olivoverticillatus]|uniref:Phosphoglycerate dehydrogenase-like enzyme n=1 Tax=Streptomyces olivoverticillatus TaxID=66427 RepID=A0A7W7PHJ9_9ACTN|nr:2-hydroxyacid dehydrogenase [Streptomyces olivoverticillatus]MBB4891141.1 phosphoglycerate dehydrogenase-like enzyme [Streptomyces olivoverticillatus]
MSADHSGTGTDEGRPLAWLPIRPEEIEGLPDGLEYAYWNGEPDFPTDPARCVFYCVPYLKGTTVSLRPLPLMPKVKVVQALTAGVDDLLPALSLLPPGARLCSARGLHDASTAELALALVLASLRDVPGFVRAQDAQEWRQGFRPALADSSVLIVGYGSIGSAVEDRLVPFECARVVRVARSSRMTARGPVHSVADLPALLPDADVVILVTPLTEETRGMADAEFLARMKDGALLVNVARGGIVDTKALLRELENGRLRAALDVTDPEPLPPGHPLWSAPGTLITPHVGGPSSAFAPRAKALLRDQLARFVRDEPLRNVVTSEA